MQIGFMSVQVPVLIQVMPLKPAYTLGDAASVVLINPLTDVSVYFTSKPFKNQKKDQLVDF